MGEKISRLRHSFFELEVRKRINEARERDSRSEPSFERKERDGRGTEIWSEKVCTVASFNSEAFSIINSQNNRKVSNEGILNWWGERLRDKNTGREDEVFKILLKLQLPKSQQSLDFENIRLSIKIYEHLCIRNW